MNHCYCCDFADTCEIADLVNFCEDCIDYDDCSICDTECNAGHFIECNNGFEPKEEFIDR